jgi:hypothetical protein
MADLSLDVEQLDGRGADLAEASRSFAEQVSRFQSQTAGLEGAWGDDMIGGLIGAAYTVVAQWALECWQDVVGELASAGEDLQGMARQFDEAEQGLTETFRRLGESLG